MKRFKTLLFSSTPFFICFGLQFIAVYYLLFVAACFLFGIAPAIQGKTYNINDLLSLASDMNFNTVASIIFSTFCIILFSIWLYKSCGAKFKVNIRKTFNLAQILGIVLLVPGAQFMSSIVSGMITMVFPSWLEQYEALLESAGLNGEVPLLMMIYSVCLAPISEELVFRGVTMRIAKRAFPFWIANIIQAFLFGIFHLNPLQSCYTFIVGLFMGYICERGSTLYHSILFHFLFNLWGTTASQWLIVEDVTLQGLIVLIGTIVGLTGGLHFFKKGTS